MFQVPKNTKWVLWFLALALLCFLASQIPAVRRHLFWVNDPPAGQDRGEPG